MTAEFNKPYVYFHSWAILIGFINHGYFGVGHQVIRIVNKDKTTEEIEKVICYILLWEYIGCAVGSIISSIAVKLSNKKRLIAGDALIVIFSGFIYFYDTEWVVILCGIFYGFGLGFVMTTVPIYLKEMAPKQVLTAILTLVGPAMIIGNELVHGIDYLMIKTNSERGGLLSIIGFIMPAILSFIQLLFLCIIFNKETPLKYCINMKDDKCLEELSKIYKSIDQRMDVYHRLAQYKQCYIYQYPSYAELFSDELRSNTAKGIIINSIKDCSGVFVTMTLASMILSGHNNEDYYFNNLLTTINLLGSIIPFLVVNIVGIKKLFLVGSIGVGITNIVAFFFEGFKRYSVFGLYQELTLVNTSVKLIFYGFSLCPLCHAYACEILTERGFALSMACHWTISGILIVSFPMFLTNFENTNLIYMGYLSFFVVASIGTIIYIWIAIPEKSQSQDDIKKSQLNSISSEVLSFG